MITTTPDIIMLKMEITIITIITINITIILIIVAILLKVIQATELGLRLLVSQARHHRQGLRSARGVPKMRSLQPNQEVVTVPFGKSGNLICKHDAYWVEAQENVNSACTGQSSSGQSASAQPTIPARCAEECFQPQPPSSADSAQSWIPKPCLENRHRRISRLWHCKPEASRPFPKRDQSDQKKKLGRRHPRRRGLQPDIKPCFVDNSTGCGFLCVSPYINRKQLWSAEMFEIETQINAPLARNFNRRKEVTQL